jgi:hypothetical protein
MDDAASKLMNALITKMEQMDNDMQDIREQNVQLRKMLINPAGLLKRAGFVRANTPAIQDVWGDPLRSDSSAIVKGVDEEVGGEIFDVPTNNEDFYKMNWDDIHALANQAKELGHVENKPLPEV